MSNMAQSPLDFEYDGKKYVLFPLRDIDNQSFELWCQDRYIEVTRRNIKDLPIEEQRFHLSQAFDRAALITFSSAEARQLMGSIEGASRLLFYSIRQGDDTFTLEQARELASDVGFSSAALTKIAYLSTDMSNKKPPKKKVKKSPVKKSTKHLRKDTGTPQKK